MITLFALQFSALVVIVFTIHDYSYIAVWIVVHY